MIAPGLREPPTVVHEREAAAIVAYVRRASRQPYPGYPASRSRPSGAVFARYCVGCHKIDGDGGTDGPDLTRAGEKHDAGDAAHAGSSIRSWSIRTPRCRRSAIA